MRTLVVLLFLCHSFYSCISKGAKQESAPVASNRYFDPYTMIKEGQTLLNEGDLVVRLNQDPASLFIKKFNRRDKSYSHAGIVMYENGYPYIYHIVTGEENPDGKLRKDSLSRFCNPRKNIAFGIFRYNMEPGEIKNLEKLIHTWYTKGLRFDLRFDLKTDNRMYCSEMIRKATAISTRKRILIETIKPTHKEATLFSLYLHLPYAYTSKLEMVPIDNLYLNPYCILIKEYNYKGNKRVCDVSD